MGARKSESQIHNLSDFVKGGLYPLSDISGNHQLSSIEISVIFLPE